MDVTLTGAAQLLHRGRQVVEETLRQAEAAPERVASLARNLHSLWPGLPLYACVVGDGNHYHAAALDGKCRAQADWTSRLEKTWDATPATAPDRSTSLLPDVAALAGLDRFVAPVMLDPRPRLA